MGAHTPSARLQTDRQTKAGQGALSQLDMPLSTRTVKISNPPIKCDDKKETVDSKWPDDCGHEYREHYTCPSLRHD